MVSLFNYLLLTNFLWMLVEGLYLHTVIVWTFSAADQLTLRHYAALGWGQFSLSTTDQSVHRVHTADFNSSRDHTLSVMGIS